MQNLLAQIPSYAKDAKINMQNLLGSEVLTKKQILGAALACAYSTKDRDVIAALESEAKDILSTPEIDAAKTASVLMAMNNLYYRFLHLSEDKEYSQMQAGLRMQGIMNHGIDKIDFEIFSLAVSVLNGCGMCIDAHAKALLNHGISKQQVQMVAKIASVINSLAQTNFLTKNN